MSVDQRMEDDMSRQAATPVYTVGSMNNERRQDIEWEAKAKPKVMPLRTGQTETVCLPVRQASRLPSLP